MFSQIRRHRTTVIIIAVLVVLCAVNIAFRVTKNEAIIATRTENNRVEGEKILAMARATRARLDFIKARTAAANDALAVAEAARSGVNQQPANMTPVCAVKDSAVLSVVVNKKNCLRPLHYVPSDLVSVQGISVRGVMQPDLTSLLTAAADAGAPITITSGFRSYSDQVATYNSYVTSRGSTAAADQFASRPSYSEHQTGLAIDLKAGGCALECFASTAQYRWLQAHATDFGFIERYTADTTTITGYSAEPWHWRYVGPTLANDIKAKGIKTLEQYYDVDGGDY